MPQRRDSHVSEQELDQLLAGEVAPQDLRIHLARCPECASLLALHTKGADVLSSLSATRQAPASDCPPREYWWNLSADPDLWASRLEHAMACEGCGTELRAAMEARVGEKDRAVSTAPLSDQARGELADRMAQKWAGGGVRTMEPVRTRRRLPPSAKYGAIAAALIAVISGALLWLRPSTDQLIARAYEQKRTVEFRLRGAAHAPLRIERGDLANRPVPLRQADARVAEALARDPDQPKLLDQQARIELLNWEYKAALPRLQRADELHPGDPEILSDLALAYLERGKDLQRPMDYGSSADALSRILKQHPDDPVVLFNRALVLEYQFLYRNSIADWEHFLRLETKGQWADEAREHLESLRKKLQARGRDVRPCPALGAREVAQWFAEGELPERLQAFEGGWECLRERALVDWLASSDDIARKAFESTAAAFRTETGDTWFSDVMRGSRSPASAVAAGALSEAVQANLQVEAGRAESAARKALELFEKIRNKAGAAQASIEYVYALRRSQRPAECRATVDRVERIIAGTSWTWTGLQARLEAASCSSLAGDFGPAKESARAVIEATRQPSLRGLHLRAISYLESLEAATGNNAAVWQQGIAGLQEFWSGREFAVWAYQLYYHLARAAATSGQNQLTLLLQRETLAEIRMANRPSMEAFTWFDYARAAMLADAAAEARTGFSTAEEQFARLPQEDRGVAATRADCEVYLAELENLERTPAAALTRLNRVAGEMESGNSLAMELHYRRAMAQSRRLLGQRLEYEADLHALIATAERGLSSLKTLPDTLRWSRQTGDGYREAAALLAVDNNDFERGLDFWEWFRGSPFRSGKYRPDGGQSPASTSQSLERLGMSQALIYVALEDRLVIWHVRGRRLSVLSIPVSRIKLAGLSERLYLLCSQASGSDTAWRAAASEVAGYLLRPVESEIVWNEPLWVELDDSLSMVPFSVLPLRSGEPAAVRAQIAIFPGIDYLKRATPIASFSAKTPMLAVGISTVVKGADGGLLPLPGAEEEARDAAGHFADARVLTSFNATADNIKRELARAVVFHFAGHSRSSDDRVALVGAGGVGDEIRAENIAAMNLDRCRLAVISACSAEAPGVSHGSRAFGLAVAFLRAGAAGVLATGWDLDTRTGSAFMKIFYRHLAAGETEARSAAAAATQIRETPGLSHPYYWAAYQFFGRG